MICRQRLSPSLGFNLEGISILSDQISGWTTELSASLYEAASIDRANKTQQFFLITLPQLKPVILSVVLLDSNRTLNLFPLIWLLTGDGPLGSTDTIASFTYRYAFVDYQFGMASAAATVGLIVAMMFSTFYLKRQNID